MDILAHTLWATAGARYINKNFKKNNKKPLSVIWTAFWGIFPDLFAFGIPLVISLVQVLRGSILINNFSHHGIAGQFNLSANLYNYSHSLVIFAIIFLITWILMKRLPFELLGWLLHILIDIPTHRISFYPTPFLFPLSNYRFPYGISWGDTWFMIVNYGALSIIYTRVLFKKRKLTQISS